MTRTPRQSTTNHPPTLVRRAFLGGVGTAAVATLAGCSTTAAENDPEPVSTPVALDGGKQDDFGGMIIGAHAGPNGQIFYREHAPHGPGTPAWFHTLAQGLFPYHFEHERLGWEAIAVYVTDYSTVDYELHETGDRTFISTHTAPSTFGDAHGMRYVAGSDVHGGMGPELIPFGESADAEAFRDEHSGSVVDFDGITEEKLVHFEHEHGDGTDH